MESSDKKSAAPSPFVALGLAGQIGYLIAIPAVAFGFGGAYLDKYLHTSPVFLLIGFAIAAGSSWMSVRRVVRKFIEIDARTPVSARAVDRGRQWREEDEKMAQDKQ